MLFHFFILLIVCPRFVLFWFFFFFSGSIFHGPAQATPTQTITTNNNNNNEIIFEKEKEREYKIINNKIIFEILNEILNEDFVNEIIFEFFGILNIPIQHLLNENENVFEKILNENKEMVFNILGDLVSPNVLFVENKNKGGFEFLGANPAPTVATVTNNNNEMIFEKEKGFKFFGVFDTPNPTPATTVTVTNDIDNGILIIPQPFNIGMLFEKENEMLFGEFSILNEDAESGL